MRTFKGNVSAHRLFPSETGGAVLAVWKTLSTIDTLSFTVRSPKSNGNYHGSGHVRIIWVGDSAMEFDETGSWLPPEGRPIHFSNIYRWVQSEHSQSLNLYHRRNEAVEPVFLCTFSPLQHGVHLRATPHRCDQDLYLGDLLVQNTFIELRWKITGPNKNDILSISYSRSLHHRGKSTH